MLKSLRFFTSYYFIINMHESHDDVDLKFRSSNEEVCTSICWLSFLTEVLRIQVRTIRSQEEEKKSTKIQPYNSTVLFKPFCHRYSNLSWWLIKLSVSFKVLRFFFFFLVLFVFKSMFWGMIESNTSTYTKLKLGNIFRFEK